MKRVRRWPGMHVLITGAASGIGKALALEYASRGARVSLADKDAERLADTARAVRARGGDPLPVHVDMGEAESIDQMASRVEREAGPVEVLVNNAGVAVVAPFLQTSPADWDWVQAVNMLGPIRLTRAVLPSMVRRGRGQVVMIASLSGLVGAPGMVAYGTTKFAIVGFAEGLRLEVADAGVDVTVVCPGYVRTNLAKATRYHNDRFRRFLDDPPFWYGLSSDRVATRVVDAVERREPLVVLGPEKVGWWLKRLAPEAAFAVSRWAARRAGIGVDAGVGPGS